MTAEKARGPVVAPSPVFYGLVLLTLALGVLLWKGYRLGGVATFAFVLSGWVVSLALHEFGHAIVAYVGGDRSVVDKGYLTLDVRKYVDAGTSLLFPILILLIGGVGLPGGAVWINTAAIRSKVMQSLMSAAGPLASAACALACLLPIRAGLVTADSSFLFALAFLGWIQVVAVLFNLLPIPGLDGFGIIEPHLAPQTRRALLPVRQYGMWILLMAVLFVPAVGDALWSAIDGVSTALGGDSAPALRSQGFREFQFWE